MPDSSFLVDEGALYASASNGVTLIDGLTDVDGDVSDFQITITSQPVNGALTLTGNHGYEYQHNGTEATSDTFEYVVADVAGNQSAPITVTIGIEAVNDNAPQVPDSSFVVDEGALYASAPNGVTLIDGLTDLDGDVSDFQITITSQPINGALTLTGNHGYEYQHNGTETTSDTFEYVVGDAAGNQSAPIAVTIGIEAVNDNAPQVPDSSFVVDEGALYASASSGVTLIDGLTDVDGDVSDFTVVITSQPGNGVLSLTGNHGFEYLHNGSETTSDSFEYLVEDGAGNQSATITVLVNVQKINDNSPQPAQHTLTVFEGREVSVTDTNAPSFLDGATDADTDDSISLTAVTDPLHGIIRWSPDGSFQYIHDGSESLTDSFTITITDEDGLSTDQLISVNILPVNDPPMSIDNLLVVQEDSDYVFNGNEFTFSDSEGNLLDAVVIDTLPVSGSLQLNSSPVIAGQRIDIAELSSGDLIYSPDANFNGIDSLAFKVADDGGNANGGNDTDNTANTLNIEVTPINDPPVVTGTLSQITINENETDIYSLDTGIFFDIDGDIDNDNLDFEVQSVDGASLPDWIEFDPVNVTLSLSPNASHIGVHVFSIRAIDDQGAVSGFANFSIEVVFVNDPPINVEPGSASVIENVSDTTLASLVVADPDISDTHTISVDDPRFEVVDNELRLRDGVTLDFEDEPQIEVVLTVVDGGLNVIESKFVIDVIDVNEFPYLTGELEDVSGSKPFVYKLPLNSFADPDDDPLTISASLNDGSPLPDWLLFDSVSGEFTVTDAVEDGTQVSVLVLATDPSGESVSDEISISVELVVAAAEPVLVSQTVLDLNSMAASAQVLDASSNDEVANNEAAPENILNSGFAGPGFSDPGISPESLRPVTVESSDNLATIETITGRASERPVIQHQAPVVVDIQRTESVSVQTNTDEALLIATSRQFDHFREQVQRSADTETVVVAATISAGTGFSVGYIIWLLRGGILLSSVLSSLPAWRNIDPLPVLSSFSSNTDEDDESIESLVTEDEGQPNEAQPNEGQQKTGTSGPHRKYFDR